ncbi:AVIL protein, partial [Amia calva]|nr:AVIL protein [Amia calva]
MELVLLPEKAYGNFFEGDCYLLLSTRKCGKSVSYDAHYWIGAESSQDEQGAAAIYITQLDTHLGGRPIQHREVQGYESDTFRAYFKQGIIYKKGGVGAGMKHTDTNTYDNKRLLHVKGKRRVTAKEVPLSWSSFNRGDVFVLDIGKTIIQWNGPDSNQQERLKRGGRAEVGVVDSEKEGDAPELMAILEGVLGKREGQLVNGTPDEEADLEQKSCITLYHVCDVEGQMKITEVATRPLSQDMLNHDDCYILDQGGVRLFVWKGKRANKAERQTAMTRAVEFMKQKNYPITTSVEAMSDGAESALFTQLFPSWSSRDQSQGMGRVYNVGKVAKVSQDKFDASLMHSQPDVAAQERMVDDGTGEVQVWRIENLELVLVDRKWHGFFYGGDCYLILYSYEVNRRKNYLLYIWQGRHSSQDEITASAFQAVSLDQKYGGQPVQVRVTMGKEPRHFMAMFKGRVVIFEGGTSRVGNTDPEPPVRLFQVRGTDPCNTKAVEELLSLICPSSPPLSSLLFLISSPLLLSFPPLSFSLFLSASLSQGSSGDEREMAKQVSAAVGRGNEEIIAEGLEPNDFWGQLGGKAPYASDKRLQQEVPDHQARLFECSNKTGRFIVIEVTLFTQDDLTESDVMLLDTWDQVFLWLGSGSSEIEREESINTCREYLYTHPGGRDPDTPILLVKQGFEPPTFTGWFTAWDPSKWSGGKSYEEMKQELGDGASFTRVAADLNGTAEETPRVLETHPRDSLLYKQTEELPKGVDPSQKERHLSDEDFQAVLGVSKDEFYTLPQWKQLSMKKKTGLF